MPPKKTKDCVPAANGNRTTPPPVSACQHHPPPPVPNKETMSSNDYSLTMSLNTAPYPPFGCHPSKPTKAPACAPIGVGKQVEKTISTCSCLVRQVATTQSLKQRGRSMTPIKNIYAIFDPSTTSTSSLTCSFLMIKTRSALLPICHSKLKTSERNVFSRSGSQGRKAPPRLRLKEVQNSRCNLSTSAARHLPHDNIHTEDVTPPLAHHNKTSIASSLGADSPYVNASAARKAAQESKIAADEKAVEEMRRASKIQEINR
jgi:hypothetical protein